LEVWSWREPGRYVVRLSFVGASPVIGKAKMTNVLDHEKEHESEAPYDVNM
jgi:hypothetical protein